MIDLIQVIQWVIIAFIIGGILPIGFIYNKRRYYKGKIYCYFYLKNRELAKRFIKPNDSGLIAFQEGYYIYNEDNINLDTHPFTGRTPSLTFIENNPLPTTHLREYTSEEVGYTAQQLQSDFEDNAMKSFREATDIQISQAVVDRVRKDFIIMFLALAGVIAIAAFFIISQNSESMP